MDIFSNSQDRSDAVNLTDIPATPHERSTTFSLHCFSRFPPGGQLSYYVFAPCGIFGRDCDTLTMDGQLADLARVKASNVLFG